MKQLVLAFSLLLVYNALSAQEIKCHFFDLERPSTLPMNFNPEILDLNGSFKFNVTYNGCNEVYFATITTSENIFVLRRIDGAWTEPQIASFSDPNYNDADPFVTNDGSLMYFISKRPTHASDNNLDFNIWYSEKSQNGWSDPKPLPKPINSDESDEYMFSRSKKGNVYFLSNRSGGNGSFDIYTAKVLGHHKFSEPKNMGAPISTKKYEFDPYIAPDESFMLFSINTSGNSDLYYTLKDHKGKWGEPKNLGTMINVTGQDFAPSLSPDGQFIFFSNNGKLRWVNSTILKN